MVKTDCFAYEKTGIRAICSALKGLQCRYSACPFYKPIKTEAKELLRYNGTASLEQAVYQYAKDHGAL